MSFRLKLLLAMVLLVVGVTAATLLITENHVRRSYEQHFQQSFRFQMATFLDERETRLEPIKERVTAAASNTRLFAAMENAGQEHPDQQDVDDLYQNGFDQLAEVLAVLSGGRTNSASGFFLFLNSKGEVLYPSRQVKLPFSLVGLKPVAQQIESVGASVIRENRPQVGYLAPEDDTGRVALREMVFTPIVDQVGSRRLGVLGLGFPLPPSRDLAPMMSAIWLDNRLYSSSIPSQVLATVEQVVGNGLRARTAPGSDLKAKVGNALHQLYYQALNTGPGFPPAYQVCLYSLTEAEAEIHRFRRTILLSGTVASVCALVLSWLISRSLAVPLQTLVAGTEEIERGNYTAKVAVRGRDELGRLGRAFNAMAQRIQSSHAALELRIAERTQELADRKRAEAALRKSEASLREAQRIARLGNWEWNVVRNELAWSDEIYSMFGLEPEQFNATYEAFLERVHPADREKVEQAVGQSLKTGQPYGIDHRVVRPDGGQRVVREQAEVFRDENGKTVRMVGTVQDITEQKRIEAEFLRAQRMDGIGAIAGGMAHDLNNALAPILMGVQLIRKKVSEPEIQEMLEVMESNTHRGADMVRQVLTFARGRDAEHEVLNAGRLLRELETMLRQTMPKAIIVQSFVPSDLWPVLGNATQLHQALLNLCINARDAMPQGGQLTLAADNIELGPSESKAIPGSKPGRYVTLMVSDTGTGILPEVLPRIFEAFFTTKPPGKGTGLGLSTVTRIVHNHGGFLNVKSERGVGSSFDLYLPRAEPGPPAHTASRDGAIAQQPGHGELILFIDDDSSVREMVTPTLKEHGYRVLTAANGVEALALIAKHEQDIRLVLTDVAMPMMNGLELLEKLHARQPELPVVLISGTVESRNEPPPTGATGFLTKPFGVEQLLNVIAKALREHPAQV